MKATRDPTPTILDFLGIWSRAYMQGLSVFVPLHSNRNIVNGFMETPALAKTALKTPLSQKIFQGMDATNGCGVNYVRNPETYREANSRAYKLSIGAPPTGLTAEDYTTVTSGL